MWKVVFGPVQTDFGQIQNLYHSQTICSSTKQFGPFQNRFRPIEGQCLNYRIFRRVAPWVILRSLFWVYNNEIKLWIFISKGSWIESPVVFELYFETVGSFRVLSRLCLLWKGIQKLRLFIDRGILKRNKFKVLLKNIQLHNFI